METIYAAGSNCAVRRQSSSWETGQSVLCKERSVDFRLSETGSIEVKRDALGSIDFGFYQQRARSLRSAEIRTVAKAILRLISIRI